MQRIRQEKTEKSNNASSAPVVIVGAGASGLVCANILRRNGIDVVIVEAQNYAGGRVKTLKGWVDWKDLDLGAEFVHGEKSVLKTLIDQNGWPCRLLFTWAQGDGETPDYPVGGGISLYYMGREKKLLRYDTQDPEIQKVNSLLWGLYELKPAPGDNRTLLQYLTDNGVTSRVLPLANAGYANTLCSSLHKLSLSNVCNLEAKWDGYGGGDYRLDGGLYQVIERLAADQDIRLEFPVKSINYEKDTITVTSSGGQSIEASKVLVTVPLPILKDEDIEFNPPLPAEKVKAIKTIGMENAIKIVMKFSKKFWPSEVHGVICSDTFLPELWFEEPTRVGVLTPQSRPVTKTVPSNTTTIANNKITVITTVTTINNSTGETKTSAAVALQPASTFTVAGFACSSIADRISKMNKDEVISNMLSQLDSMFAKRSAYELLANSAHPPASVDPSEEGVDWSMPASSCFLECLIHDWGKVQYVKGGYSSPTVGATRQTREDLNRPIQDKIFFAGEATNPDSFMTLHGAMETGEMAANAILRSLNPAKAAKIKAKL